MTQEEINARKEELFGVFNEELRTYMEKAFDKGLQFAKKETNSYQKFKHKVLGVIGTQKSDGHLHYEMCSGNMCRQDAIHMDFVRNSNDWELVETSSYFEQDVIEAYGKGYNDALNGLIKEY